MKAVIYSTLREYKSARMAPHPWQPKLNWTIDEPNRTNWGLTGPTIPNLSLSLSSILYQKWNERNITINIAGRTSPRACALCQKPLSLYMYSLSLGVGTEERESKAFISKGNKRIIALLVEVAFFSFFFFEKGGCAFELYIYIYICKVFF